MRLATVCGMCHTFFLGHPPDSHACRHGEMKRSEGVQIGAIDGEQLMYGPPSVGPYAYPGKSLLRRLPNNRHWREKVIKASEGKIGDC